MKKHSKIVCDTFDKCCYLASYLSNLSKEEKEAANLGYAHKELSKPQHGILQEAYNREKEKALLINERIRCNNKYRRYHYIRSKFSVNKRRKTKKQKRFERKYKILRELPVISTEQSPISKVIIKQTTTRKKDKEQFAKQLKANMTAEEKLILPELTSMGFLPQEIVLGFIPDFWLPKKKIIIEIDGGYHSDQWQEIADRERDAIFKRNGFKVLRFTNEQVITSLPKVLAQIKSVVN